MLPPTLSLLVTTLLRRVWLILVYCPEFNGEGVRTFRHCMSEMIYQEWWMMNDFLQKIFYTLVFCCLLFFLYDFFCFYAILIFKKKKKFHKQQQVDRCLMTVMCRFVCGEGAGLHGGEAEESCWTVILGTAGEVSHTLSTNLIAACF